MGGKITPSGKGRFTKEKRGELKAFFSQTKDKLILSWNSELHRSETSGLWTV